MSRFDRRKAEAGEGPAPTREKRGTLAPLIIFIAIVVFIVVALVTSRSAATERPFSYTELLMDTEVNLQIFCRGSGEARRAKEALFDEMKRLERLLSYSDPKSDLARINRAAGERPVEVSPETVEVIQKALDYSSISEELLTLQLPSWSCGFREEITVPDPDELEEAGHWLTTAWLRLAPRRFIFPGLVWRSIWVVLPRAILLTGAGPALTIRGQACPD